MEGNSPGLNDIALTLLAVAGWVLAAYQMWETRRHNRLTTRPILTTTRVLEPLGDEFPTPGLYVANHGFGPAVITSLHVTVDGERVEGTGFYPWLAAVERVGLSAVNPKYGGIDLPIPLMVGHTLQLLMAEEPTERPALSAFLKGLTRIGFELQYESCYKERFTEVLSPYEPPDQGEDFNRGCLDDRSPGKGG
jgi:hypothetical protein